MRLAVLAYESGAICVANGRSGAEGRKRFNLCGFLQQGGRVVGTRTISETCTLLVLEKDEAEQQKKEK